MSIRWDVIMRRQRTLFAEALVRHPLRVLSGRTAYEKLSWSYLAPNRRP